MLIGGKTEECPIKMYVQFYQHPSDPQSERVATNGAGIGLDTDKGSPHASSY